MVPLICVIYHIAHLRTMTDGHSPCLPYVESSWDGASAAYDTIINNLDVTIGLRSAPNPFLLSDLLEQIWVNLQHVTVERPGRRTWLYGHSIIGHELMDVVNPVPPLKLKRIRIRENGGWIKLMRDIEVV